MFHGMSIVATCCQRSLSTTDWTVVRRILCWHYLRGPRLVYHTAVDSTMRVRVARVHLRQLILYLLYVAFRVSMQLVIETAVYVFSCRWPVSWLWWSYSDCGVSLSPSPSLAPLTTRWKLPTCSSSFSTTGFSSRTRKTALYRWSRTEGSRYLPC